MAIFFQEFIVAVIENRDEVCLLMGYICDSTDVTGATHM